MRIISLDIETTGLHFYEGHKITEIGCIEIKDEKITKNIFHSYINPKRDIDKEAKKITGITENFLKDKPEFKDIVEEFLNFIKESDHIIIHNAKFDVNFINNELKLINYKIKDISKNNKIIDTLELARKLHPGKKNNLDSLSKRYNINISKRELHGALIDARLLAEIYIKIYKKNIKLNFKKKYDIPEMIKTLETNLIKAEENEIKKHKEYITKIINRKL